VRAAVEVKVRTRDEVPQARRGRPTGHGRDGRGVVPPDL